MKGFLRGPSASEHRRTSVPAPARVSASSHMGFSHRRSVLRPLFRTLHGLLGYQRSSALFRPVCLSSICLSITRQPIRLPALLFVASKTALFSIRTFGWTLNRAQPSSIPFPCLLIVKIVSASSSAPPAPLGTRLPNSLDSPTLPERTGRQFPSGKLRNRNWLLMKFRYSSVNQPPPGAAIAAKT